MGIQLDRNAFYKQKLPKEAVKHKINKKAALPTPKLAYATATLKGKILDYQKDMMKQMRMHIESPASNIHNEPEYYKNRGGWQLSSRSKSSVRHKRCIGDAFRLGGMPDSPQ